MRKVILFVLIFSWVSISFVTAKDVKLGKDFELKELTKISAIMDKPEEYNGKIVKVEGLIVDGCKHKGTWIGLASDKEFQKISIWDTDRKITFPLEHKGKYAVVEGVVYDVQLNEEQARRWLKHLAAEHTIQTDPAKVQGGMTLYRISPYAVVIKDKK